MMAVESSTERRKKRHENTSSHQACTIRRQGQAAFLKTVILATMASLALKGFPRAAGLSIQKLLPTCRQSISRNTFKSSLSHSRQLFTSATTRRCLYSTSIFNPHSTTSIFMSAMEDAIEVNDKENITTERTWNLPGLRKEVSRLTMRCHKKIGKANQRLQIAQQEVDRLSSNPDVSLEELDQCRNIDELQADLAELQARLKGLNQLEVLLQDIPGKKSEVTLPEHVAQLAIDLEVDDGPPQRPEQGRRKKEKGPKEMKSFRLPYRRYYTANKTEIRVGKQAEDNDELTLSPKHRDGLDWWMHASGCPGSHVIIRCHDQNVNEDVVMDAAALAARQSKCNGNIIKVSMTRARDITKPPGAKAGLVQLTGNVRTVTVNMKEAQSRLDRLDKTVLIN